MLSERKNVKNQQTRNGENYSFFVVPLFAQLYYSSFLYNNIHSNILMKETACKIKLCLKNVKS